MAVLSKRMRLIKETVDRQKEYPIVEAIQLLQSLPKLKFPESVEASIHLNFNQKKSDQKVRGVVVLPHGTGRKARVIVFAEDKGQIEAAEAAGAARVGFEGLASEIKQGEFGINERDTLIATPAAMRLLVPLGVILGPKGLMPNLKLGTVTDDPASAVRDALLGRVQYRSDKGGVIRCLVGKLSFKADDLQANLQTLLMGLLRDKPDSAPKGKAFIKKVAFSSSMGPGLWIDQSSLDLGAVS
jgi:large subunit ribosomal protein L1